MSRKLGKRKLKECIGSWLGDLRVIGVEPSDKAVNMYVRGRLKDAMHRLALEAVVAYARDASIMSRMVDWRPAPSQTTSPLAARNLGDA